MEAEVFSVSNSAIRFLLRGISPAIANSLRRAIIAEVPSLAIDEILVYKNQSVMYDEQIALRLGLIPLKADINTYYFPDECECNGQGCPLCEVRFTLSEIGPKVVYSGDLRSSDPDVAPASDRIPIIELKEGQEIALEAIARLGRGRDHAKWQPSVAAGYKYLPGISVSTDCTLCMECVDACPRGLLAKGDETIVIAHPEECNYCKLCVEACDAGAITLTEDESSFVFYLESDGSMSVSDIVIEAINIMKDKAEELRTQLEGL